MSDDLSSMSKNRSELARIFSRNPDPDVAQVRLIATNLACAKIDGRIRESLAEANRKYGAADDPVRLGPAHVAHLVSLLLSEAGVPGKTVTLVEKIARVAVQAAQEDPSGRAFIRGVADVVGGQG